MLVLSPAWETGGPNSVLLVHSRPGGAAAPWQTPRFLVPAGVLYWLPRANLTNNPCFPSMLILLGFP